MADCRCKMADKKTTEDAGCWIAEWRISKETEILGKYKRE